MNAKHSSQSNHIPAMLGDAVIVVLAFVSAMLGRFLFDRQINPLPGARFGNWNSAPGAVCLLLFLSAYLWTAQQYGLYSSRSSASRFHQITKTCQACLNGSSCSAEACFLSTRWHYHGKSWSFSRYSHRLRSADIAASVQVECALLAYRASPPKTSRYLEPIS
jgi:hypothetical protein